MWVCARNAHLKFLPQNICNKPAGFCNVRWSTLYVMIEYSVRPIGFVTNSRKSIVDDHWGEIISTIKLDLDVLEESALDGLNTFSHVEIIYLFDQVANEKVSTGSRHLRNNNNWPLVGILAQRAKDRVNRLGLTTCTIESVGTNSINVLGLDAIDGTPVLDIKPFMREFGPRGTVKQPEWATELMRQYW